MLTRRRGYLLPRSGDVPAASRQLEDEGYTVLEAIIGAAAIAELSAEINALYAALPPDGRHAQRPVEEDNDFRYEMLNRSALCQATIGHPAILEAIEPLLGEDCHVIANTCWRNPPRERNTHGGGAWHIDAGPHIPRAPGIPWDDRIPYPVFAIGAHIYLQDCPIECGPTGVIPRSHKSGQRPPEERVWDVELTCEGRGVIPLTARAGDVAMFVSDVWHRRLPPMAGDSGRFFLQAHYGRRDIAQRIRSTSDINHLSADARNRALTPRQRSLVGLHPNFFYDG
ncbi:MAG TPA: phytanoyl-CoA dioxygenase family protein [Pseudomonadales bacterium]